MTAYSLDQDLDLDFVLVHDFSQKMKSFRAPLSVCVLSHYFLFLLCSLSLDRVSVSSDLTLVLCSIEISQKCSKNASLRRNRS